MMMKHSTILLANVLLAPTLTVTASMNSSELIAAYPDLASNSTRTGNPNILCPFLRLLERSGRLDSNLNEDADYNIHNDALKSAADDFGCDSFSACGPVVDLVSSGQAGTTGVWQWLSIFNPFDSPQVDLQRLWDAPPVSHDCGFTFAQGATSVSQARLNSTLTKFQSKMDGNQTLSWPNIRDVKLEICAEEGVEMSSAGDVEAQLIYAYLGGVDRGYVDYNDVEGFLQVDNQMPATKADEELTAWYLARVQ